jgi:hypothetical protein
MKIVLLLIVVVLVSGCATANLYPVQGPLSARTPPPTYKVRMDNLNIVTFKLGTGDLCSGMWSNLPKEDPTSHDLSAEWDLVYGKGFFLTKVLGNIGLGRAMLTCTKGATVNVEFTSDKGVAKDSNGDVFKLTFR